ncbi:MAG: sigma-70 family RNA polymerase sigma factor [Opitutaceae bacterium]|nr:sigma-70 family RNA polymerase sigma factor [Opitutaceae bacterium]
MVEDSELLHRFAREGDQSAFAELVTRHLDRAYAVALRGVGGDTHLAEDVAQIVFTTLARKAASLIDHPALSAWIHRTTHHVAIDAVRSEARRRAREEKAQVMHGLHDDPARDADWEKLRPDLDAVLAALPERDRIALALRYFEDRAFAEIGRRLSVSEDAARMRVDRALEKMRTRLARRGIACTAAVLGGALTSPGLVAAPSGLAGTVTTTALGASATGLGTGAILSLVSSTKLATGVAAAIVVVTVGIGILDTANRRHVMATRAATDAERLAALTAEVDELERQVRDQTADQPPTPVPAAKPVATDDPEALGRQFLADHPAVHQAFIRSVDAKSRMQFGGLFRELSLSSTQVDEFLTIQRPWTGSFRGPWGPNGISIMLRPGLKTSGEERDQQLSAVLGAEGLRRFREYVSTSDARKLAMTAASYLAFDSEPLSAEQIEELTRSIHARSYGNAPGATTQYAWQTILEDSQGILTPAQLEAIDYLHADDTFQTAVRERAYAPRP